MKKVGLILLGILMAVGVSAEVKKIKGTGYLDRKSTRLNSSHSQQSRMPSSA